VRLDGLGQFKKSNDIGNRTRDLTACSIVPQPTTRPLAPPTVRMKIIFWDLLACSLVMFSDIS
jgi:hypothetical protein